MKTRSILSIASKPLYVLAFVIILAGTLPGCAAYSAYTKCGSGGCPGDAKITAEVRALLNQHPALGPPNQIYVQTLDLVVYLTGQTATDLQRDTAESVAREATGLSRVVNNNRLNLYRQVTSPEYASHSAMPTMSGSRL